MSDERIRRAQLELRALGYDPGAVDGHDGPRTTAALKAYALDKLVLLQRTSPQGLAATATYEGIVPGPYLDSKGVWTWGIGHTAAAGAPDPASMPRGTAAGLDAALQAAVVCYRADIATSEERVRRAFTRPLQQHQFDAAVSFDINTGAILRAAWVGAFNAGDDTAAVEKIMNWRSPPEIIARRKLEQAMFGTGVYPGTPIAVWGVDTAGNVQWNKPIRLIEANDFAAMVA